MSTAEALAWLRQQIEGDKSAAEAAAPGPWDHDGDDDVYTVHHGEHGDLVGNTVAWARGGERESATGRHIALHDPPDVIADCEAKLAILHFRDLAEMVAAAADDGQTGKRSEAQQAKSRQRVADVAVRHLATAYRHRPGYTEHWGSGD